MITEALFVTALAAPAAARDGRLATLSATAVGFLGVVVMLGPFSGGIEHYALVVLPEAVFSAFAVISLRLGSTLDPTVTVLYQALVVLALTAPLAWWYWQPVTLAGLQVVFMMSLVMVVACSSSPRRCAWARPPPRRRRLSAPPPDGRRRPRLYAEVPSCQDRAGASRWWLGSATHASQIQRRRRSGKKGRADRCSGLGPWRRPLWQKDRHEARSIGEDGDDAQDEHAAGWLLLALMGTGPLAQTYKDEYRVSTVVPAPFPGARRRALGRAGGRADGRAHQARDLLRGALCRRAETASWRRPAAA
ncbi:MAG: hypothetical protein R3C69_11290 [Geminicoccaceae bacterium]